MRIYRPPELCALADAYCAGTGTNQTALTAAIAVDDKLFGRLSSGRGCHSKTLEKVSDWFVANWPDDLPWPGGIDRPVRQAA